MSNFSDALNREGYVVLQSLLDQQEVAQLVGTIDELCTEVQNAAPLKWGVKDGVSKYESLWWLLKHLSLLEAVRATLGNEDIRYTENSSIKLWKKQTASGWHRDSVEVHYGEGGDWGNPDYGLVREVNYLQPREHKFEWGVIPGSHKYEDALSLAEQAEWGLRLNVPRIRIGSRLPYLPISDGRVWIRTSDIASRAHPPTEPVWIRPVPGDVILFDPRLIHVGGDVPVNKYALLFSYGISNYMSQKHMLYHSHEWCQKRLTADYQPFMSFLEENKLLLI